jgi:hypothetical protein
LKKIKSPCLSFPPHDLFFLLCLFFSSLSALCLHRTKKKKKTESITRHDHKYNVHSRAQRAPCGGHGDGERGQGTTQAEAALTTGHGRCGIIGIFRVFFSMRLCFVPLGVFGVAQICLVCVVVSIAVAGYARSQGWTPVSFGPTDLVCYRTLQGHTGKGFVMLSVLVARRYRGKDSPSLLQKTLMREKPRSHCAFSASQGALQGIFFFLFLFVL